MHTFHITRAINSAMTDFLLTILVTISSSNALAPQSCMHTLREALGIYICAPCAMHIY